MSTAARIGEAYRDQRMYLLRRATALVGACDAEDVVQEAVLVALLKSQEDGIQYPRSFLGGAVGWKGMENRQKRSRRLQREIPALEELAEYEEAILDHLSPERIFEAARNVDRIDAMIARMPADHREAFLDLLQGKPYTEIARTVGWSVGKVWNHMADLKARLAGSIDWHGAEQ